LRIDSLKLLDLMDHDERLESSIRFLLLKSLLSKVEIGNKLLFAQQQQCENDSNNVSENCRGDASESSAKENEQNQNEAM